MATSTAETIRTRAYRALLEAICGGALDAGAALEVARVARRVGLPGADVEAALERLVGEGFAIARGAGRYAVARVEPDDARRVIALRAEMDALAAVQAAANADADARVVGLALLAEGREAMLSSSVARIVEADLAFHRFLAELAGDPVLIEAGEIHWSWFRRVMLDHWTPRNRMTLRAAWDEHAALLDLICAGAGADAERLARRHAEKVGSHLVVVALDRGRREEGDRRRSSAA